MSKRKFRLKVNKRKQVGILGGTFNPPHLGHLIIADQVACQLHLDKVYLMPDARPPHLARKVHQQFYQLLIVLQC